jgi:glycosyltransferase involved in cell wall biosynthesis
MKILFFADSLIAGGLERRLIELLKYLKNSTRYELSLVITEDQIFYESIHDLGITLHVLKRKGLKYDPGLFVRFYKYCKKFQPDIIHAWGKMTTLYAIPAKKMLGKPLISNLVADSKKIIKRWSLDNLFYAADIFFSEAILSNSEAGLRAYGITSPKARVIRNGVHLERFLGVYNQNLERERLNIKTRYMVVMIACFTSSKDYDLFINVAKEMSKIRNNITFVGVGDGPEWQRINARIMDESVDNVVLTGDQNHVEPIIAASDIGLLCTYSEGISNSIIEYMAMGRPVITTDLEGGSEEIVIEGLTGFITERKAEGIAALIEMLLKNTELRRSMGEKGKARINSQFSIERMGKDYEDLYTEVVN